MKPIPHRHHAAGKRKIRRRLDRPVTAPTPDPVFTASNIHYDVASKTRAIPCGGIGAIQLLVRKLGLAEAIDDRLHLLKIHLPYHESDHVLNCAYYPGKKDAQDTSPNGQREAPDPTPILLAGVIQRALQWHLPRRHRAAAQ